MKNYEVVQNQQLSPTSILLTLRPQDPARAISFRAGQYAAISFHRHGRPTVVRCFSIVNSPHERGVLQFGLRVGGDYTRAATQLVPGDAVRVMGAFGHFTFRPEAAPGQVFIAGGIGITPVMSMLRTALRERTPNRLTLIYSVRSGHDAPFLPELREMVARHPEFRLVLAVSSGDTAGLGGLLAVPGRITPALLDNALRSSYQGKQYYICGPEAFMKAIQRQLVGKGVGQEAILTEAFSQSAGDRQRFALPRRVYHLSAVGFLLATLLVMGADLKHTGDRAEAAASVTAGPTVTPNSTSAATASTPQSAVAATPRPAPVATYQPPVTRTS